MQTEQYWRQFETSGKIEDYLSYRSLYQENDSRRIQGIAGCESDYRERAEHAGDHRRDGDDFKTVTHG
ncbi:MAG: hypothetical protein IJ147_06885 [Lachnospiraceae bacterium]|nr:hypothetical protein [Lachnospiraceae bacterium]MBQ8117760.1 hypothetical protein [Lachnospiraceae bacterium]